MSFETTIDRLSPLLSLYAGGNWREYYNELPIDIKKGVIKIIDRIAKEESISPVQVYTHFLGNKLKFSKPTPADTVILWFANRSKTLSLICRETKRTYILPKKLTHKKRELSCYFRIINKEYNQEYIAFTEAEAIEKARLRRF